MPAPLRHTRDMARWYRPAVSLNEAMPVAAVLRVLMIVPALAGFLLVAAPLQNLARRRGWPVARRIPLLFGRTLCRLMRMRLMIEGAEARGPVLIVANHVSWADVIALAAAGGPFCFLAKSEVASWPVFGALARVQGTVFVERARKRAIPAVNAAMAARMGEGEPVVLFAEATTSDGTRLERYRSSHFAAARDLLARRSDLDAVAIQPVSIAYVRRDGLPLGKRGRADVAWYGDTAFVPHIWTLLKAGRVDCVVTFCPPIAYVRGADRKAVARQARLATQRAFQAAVHGRPVAQEAGNVPGAILIPAENP